MDSSLRKSVAEIRNRLEKEKALKTKRLSDLDTQDPFSDPERTIDNAASDQEASEESVHDRVAALKSALHEEISAIDRALAAIGEGTYGLCQGCGRRIPDERLSVIPEATLCVDCESVKKNRIHG